MQFSPTPVTSSSFSSYILLSTLFSNTLSLCSPLNVRDEVSHPYRTTGKFIVFYIVPCWRYLLGLQTTPLNCSQSFIADSTSRYYNHSITLDSDPLMLCVRAAFRYPHASKLLAHSGC
jgi:hypothetical protein